MVYRAISASHAYHTVLRNTVGNVYTCAIPAKRHITSVDIISVLPPSVHVPIYSVWNSVDFAQVFDMVF